MTPSRFLRIALVTATVAATSAAVAQNTSPLGQAGATAPAAGSIDNLEFSGVSTVGKKTMVNLYDKQEKRSFWMEAGTTSGDITVVSYDSAKDQITLRRGGREKLLPLRPPSAVVNGTPTAVAAPPPSPTGPVTPAPAPAAPLSQARQEEEARMLVSDLLEIGMAQRRAYEEAQKRAAANGQNSAPAQPAPAPDPTLAGATPTPPAYAGAATTPTTTTTAQPADGKKR